MKSRPSVSSHEQSAASLVPLRFVSGDVWSQDENYGVRRRNHPFYLLLYTTAGEGYLSYEGREYPLLPGTAFLIDCMQEQIYHTVGKRWDFVFIHFVADGMKEYVDRLYRDHGVVFSIPDGGAMERNMREAISAAGGYSAAAPHRAFGLLAEILSMLYASAEDADRSLRISPHTESILKIIEEHYAEKLTLDLIAQQASYSKYYLAHQFKADMGISVCEYLTLFRIGKSKLLLINTNLSVAEVAAGVGFLSVSNFIRTFSQYETITPHRYRMQWQ